MVDLKIRSLSDAILVGAREMRLPTLYRWRLLTVSLCVRIDMRRTRVRANPGRQAMQRAVLFGSRYSLRKGRWAIHQH